MKAASLAEIKKELKVLDQEDLVQLCLRMGRFKKDNKELLTYLLFDAQDEESYIVSLKSHIDELMEDINTSNLYYTKKGLQKINRSLTKFLRYSGNKATEIQVLLHFLQSIRSSGIQYHRSQVLINLYNRILAKVNKALLMLHEDLQADYRFELEKLQNK